jgi:hypothetical protein
MPDGPATLQGALMAKVQLRGSVNKGKRKGRGYSKPRPLAKLA